MANGIGAALLATATAGGLAFLLSGGRHASHCGPCLSGACRKTAAPAEPERLPASFRTAVRFDEPPIRDAGVVPANFEVAAPAVVLMSEGDRF